MRLLRVDIEEFRSIQKQWLPADGLVVLFGPNSAGKTSVLEAVEHLITQAGTLRSDPGVPDEVFIVGSVTFDLPAADVAVGRLLAEAARAGIEVHAVGLRQPDILYYLDETICRQVSPAFPGWQAAADERVNAGTRMPWKKWVESRYGLPLSREGIRQLARISREQHKIPTELAQKIHGLTAFAAMCP